MATLFLLSLAVAAVVLVLAGFALDGEAKPDPVFAKFTNGADTDDALKSHRSR